MASEGQRRETVEQLAEEFVERYRRGERPALSEFTRRYPEHADEIRELFPALVMMEQIAPDIDDSTGISSSGFKDRDLPARLERLGEYRILREIGRGGMGVVYEAQQLSLGRHVAIKVLPAHTMLDSRHLARFQREARSAAKLHHTNIVPVFGVGEQDGLSYYVMQFIRGLGLDVVLEELRRLRQPREKAAPIRGDATGLWNNATPTVSGVEVAHGLLSGDFRQPGEPATRATAPGEPAAGAASSVRPADNSATIHLPGQTEPSTLTESGRPYWQSVARIGMQVGDALAHAASQGILHRDIKPANLLLDDTGNVWVTDFGLAKAANDADDLTRTGDVVGTLRYMAPERFNGLGDVRSDVYSLGLTLYELLVLRPAFDEAERDRLIKRVLHDEPVPPRKLDPAIPRDLETVVLKSIARDPARRYQTPAEMAQDLKRFVEDQPVKARRISAVEKLGRWCRRNPLPSSLLVGIVLLFLTGFALVFWQWGEAKRREGEAVVARNDAKQARNAAARQAAALLLDRGIEDARGGEAARALHLFVRALRTLPDDDPDGAPLERVIRANLTAWAETVPALEHIWPAGPRHTNVVFSPDGEMAAVAVGKDEILCFRTDTGRPVGPPARVPDKLGLPIVFAPDGRSLWVGSDGERDGDPWFLQRLDPASGRPVQPPIPTAGPVSHLAVTANGRYVVAAVRGLHPQDRGPGADANRTRTWQTASIMVWEAANGRVVRNVNVNGDLQRFNAAFLGLSPDGKTVTVWVQRASNQVEGMTFTVDGNEPPIPLGLHSLGAWSEGALHFQNSLRTALVYKDGQLHRWSVTNPGGLGRGVPAPFRTMLDESAPDGRSVISGEQGRAFDVGSWPPRASGVQFAHPGWQQNEFKAERYSQDGRFVATWIRIGGNDQRLWRLPRPHSRPPIAFAESARLPDRDGEWSFARFDRSGTRAILWQRRGNPGEEGLSSIRLTEVATGVGGDTRVGDPSPPRVAVFAPDGRYFATGGGRRGTARVWESATGRAAGPDLQHTNSIETLAFSPDGNTLAAGDYAGEAKLWDWGTGREVRASLRHDDIVLNVSFSPDGRSLAVVTARDWSGKPELVVWNVATGTPVVRVPHFADEGSSRNLGLDDRFRPDGRAVAARDENGVLRLWECPGGKLLGERLLEGIGVTRFSADGRVIAAATNLGVRLLDGDTLAALPGGHLPHPDPIQDVAFSPDGAFLLTAHTTGSAQLWDVASRKQIGPPAVLLGPIRSVTFTPDGKTCACVAADGSIRCWPVPAPFAEPDLVRLADRVALMTGQRMDDSQGLEYVPADEWRALRSKVVGTDSTALIPPRPDADWHGAAAADAEQDGDAVGAEWHLGRLAALRPTDWTVPARRGRILTAAGCGDEAGTAYEAARSLAPSPQVLSDWLRAAAAVDEAAGRKKAARWNLDRAITLTPDDWTLYALRANLGDRLGRVADEDEAIRRGAEPNIIVRFADREAGFGNWERAATLIDGLARNPDAPTKIRYLQALACLKARDAACYRGTCAAIANRLPPVGANLSPGEANDAAMAFVLGPNATGDWGKPLAWIDHALAGLAEIEKSNPVEKDQIRQMRQKFMTTRGAVLYRAGRFEEATTVLREGLRGDPDTLDFHGRAFLALAENRLGDADGANQFAATARVAKAKAKPETVWAKAEVELLAAELDAALPPAVK